MKNSEISEIRVYYESIEQGVHFIKPIIKESLSKLKKELEVKLVSLKGNYEYYSKNIAPIIFWKDPDILVTITINNVEYPLFLIEFSNAVFTEDHELQRFDGLVAAAENNCIYVKISPLTKQSASDHGGNIDFDYIFPFSLIYKKFDKLFYHFDWECDKKGIVIVDDKYLSCPKKIGKFNFFVDKLIEYIFSNNFDKEKWMKNFEKLILKDSFFTDWKNKIESFKFPDIKNLNTSRTQWINEKKEFILKLNRFGHAMDPERGMLSFYGTLYNNTVSKMLFDDSNNAWYKDTPRESEIKNYIEDKGLKNGHDFFHCFILGSGLYNNEDFIKLLNKVKGSTEKYIELNLTQILTKNYFNLNKAMRTIFKYSTYFYIVDSGGDIRVKIFWDKFNMKEDYQFFAETSNIKLKENLEEDTITYITVHNILSINKHKVIALSYPGAQADRVILIEAGTGRRQQRRYIDIISYLPDEYTSLQENKGKYAKKEIQKDIDELSKFKEEDTYKKAINNFIERFDNKAPKIIKIGVGFWANPSFSISSLKELNLQSLDYFIYVTPDRKEWTIWSNGEGKLFSIPKGKVKLPITYEIVNNNFNKIKLH